MEKEAVLIALRADEARECLTDKQRAAVDAFLEHRTVAGTARVLKVSRQTTMKHLRLAGKKLLAFGRSVQTQAV